MLTAFQVQFRDKLNFVTPPPVHNWRIKEWKQMINHLVFETTFLLCKDIILPTKDPKGLSNLTVTQLLKGRVVDLVFVSDFFNC